MLHNDRKLIPVVPYPLKVKFFIIKVLQFTTRIFADFTPYFQPVRPSISAISGAWSSLMFTKDVLC